MQTSFIQLSLANIEQEHICCAFSDKKCAQSYQLKKAWLTQAFENDYKFERLNERAKVFIEYGPAEHAWLPIEAPNYFNLNCFWVSGKYKGQGYAKTLLEKALHDAHIKGKNGIVTVVGTKKLHFMSDTKWLLQQGFQECQRTNYGLSLLVKHITPSPHTSAPIIKPCAIEGICPEKNGLVVYYSNRCPFTDFHVNNNLVESAAKRNIPLKIIQLKTLEQAQIAPTAATIFSLFYNGKFITQDLSCCMDNKI